MNFKSLFTSFIITFFIMFSGEVTAQSDSTKSTNYRKSEWFEKIYTGGNIGLSFGSITYVDVSPLVGYNITEKFSAGLGVTYMYFSQKYSSGTFSTNIYGGRIFSRYLILENVFAYSEYEVLNAEVYEVLFRKNVRKNIDSFYIGAGYQQQAGRNSSVNIMVLWNLNQGPYSFYNNPLIRGGINVGF